MPGVQNGWRPGRKRPCPSCSFTNAPQRRQLAPRQLLTDRGVQIRWFPKRSEDPGFCVKPVNSSSQGILFYKVGRPPAGDLTWVCAIHTCQRQGIQRPQRAARNGVGEKNYKENQL